MNEEICGNCNQEDRKRMGYLCDKIDVEDGDKFVLNIYRWIIGEKKIIDVTIH